MKQSQIKSSAKWLSVFTFAVVCAVTPLVYAGPPDTTNAAVVSNTNTGPGSEAWARRLASLKMEALPLVEVVKELDGKFPEVNFIVPDAGRDATVSLNLRNVSLQEVLDAIEMSSEGAVRSMKRGNMVSFAVARSGNSRGNSALCRVFRLSPYLDGKSEKESEVAVKSLYDALTLAWTMLGEQERGVQRPNLTIHRETKLLIAVGREKELSVVEQVVRELGAVVTTRALPGATELKAR